MYRKLLKMSQESIQKRSKGQIINLMSNDVMRFDLMCLFVNFLLIGPIQCIAIIVIGWKAYKFALLAGIGVIALLATLQGCQSRIFSWLRQQTATKSDRRIKIGMVQQSFICSTFLPSVLEPK